MLAEVWHQVTAVQPRPALWVVVATGVVALLFVFSSAVLDAPLNLVTLVHEAGHVVGSLVTGRRLEGVWLHSGASGETYSTGERGLGEVVMLAAGYPAPALFGLGTAALLERGHVAAVLWLALAGLAGMLVLARTAFAVFAIVVTGAVVFAVLRYTGTTTQNWFAYTLTWFLLLSGASDVAELQYRRYLGEEPDSDADVLADLTGVPAILWVVLFGTVGIVALVIGGRWLLT